MKTVIITANFGGYEELKPALPQDGCEVEFICVTDDIKQPANGWRLHLENSNAASANMMGKTPKCTPWMFTQAGQSIWIDASFRITSRKMAQEMMMRAHPIAQFLHPDRDCIYEEAAFSAKMDRYKDLPLFEQIGSYGGEHPPHWGLWAGGVIVRKHTHAIVEAGHAWLAECQRWGEQDQLSEAPTLRAAGIRPASLPGSLYNNRWLSFEPSKRHQEERK